MAVKQADYFEFSGFQADFDKRRIEFDYKIGLKDGQEETYQEVILLPEDQQVLMSPDTVQPVLQSLHLMLGISYWKLYCPQKIRINGYSLSKEQADFWNAVYTKGLVEFFYKNK